MVQPSIRRIPEDFEKVPRYINPNHLQRSSFWILTRNQDIDEGAYAVLYKGYYRIKKEEIKLQSL